jgi:hypothetical protein
MWALIWVPTRERGEQAIYIRRVKRQGDDGYDYQLVRSYREGGTVKKEVLVHLGAYWDTEDALLSWREACRDLEQLHRTSQAQKLRAKCDRLTELTRADTDEPKHREYFFGRR